VNKSELICVKLLPTGSGGGGGGGGGVIKEEEDESEEHPLVTAIMHKHKTTADMASTLRIMQSSRAYQSRVGPNLRNPLTLRRGVAAADGYRASCATVMSG